MTEADVLAWYGDLVARAGKILTERRAHPSLPEYMQSGFAMAWISEAHTALATVFPASHPIAAAWNGVFERAKTHTYQAPTYELKGPSFRTTSLSEPYAVVHFSQLVGIFVSAHRLLTEGRLRSLLAGVQVGTIAEVLDQADVLLRAGYALAAAVLAGGALETHLLHLCDRNKLTWSGDGSISKYDQAIAQARNAGKGEIYTGTDTKLVTSWGGIRNEAAHEPTKFNRTVDEIRLMVDGIRQFIARVP